MSSSDAPAPLRGVRVLDLTNVLSGPFCCHQLACLGAEVIKVEHPAKGDLARELGASGDLNAKLMGVSFLAQNSGKRSITIDLKTDNGRSVLEALVKKSDVLVENFRPGVMNRLGLDFDHLLEINPKLIYCAITGFGQLGDLRDVPAYDQIIQGMSGAMSITGRPDATPLRVGYPVADTAGGLTAALAIAGCLAEKDREKGRYIDVSMLDSVMTTMGWAISNFLNAGVDPKPLGNDNFTASPSGTFKTATDPINIAANKQQQFESLCHILGKEELISDPRFSNRAARLENRSTLAVIIEGALMERPAREWWSLLVKAGVPAGEVLSVPDVLALPHIQQRELLAEFDDVPGVDGKVRVLRTGYLLDGKPLNVSSAPPVLGADNQTILAELGYAESDIEALRQEGVIL